MPNLPIKYLNWKAIVAGAVFAVGLTFLFNLLTIALGLTLLSPNQTDQIVLSFSAVAWAVIGSYITLFLAGYVAGRMISNEYSFHWVNGLLHGFMTWSMYLIFSWILVAIMTEAAPIAMLTSFFPRIDRVSAEAASAANKLGYLGLVSFFIFLIGAIGASIGAHCGIRECKKYYA